MSAMGAIACHTAVRLVIVGASKENTSQRRPGMKAIVIAVGLIAAHGSLPVITSQQALRVVEREVFKNNPKVPPPLYSDLNDPTFYFIEAAWDNPRGSMIAGHYAVNLRTTTLWNVQGSVCSILTSAQLSRFQQTLRQSLPMDRPTFAKLSSQRPIVCSEVEGTRDARAH